MVRLDSAVGHGLTQTRRASDTKTANRHLSPGSGDVGMDERAGPIHEVQERLVLHPSRASVPPAIADITNHIRNRLSGDLFQQPASRLSCEAADDQGAD
jgi:hypothetical protein